MSAVGKLIGGLFGGNTPRIKMPTPTAPIPRISDAASEGAARAARSQARNRFGYEDSVLGASGKLGSSGVPAAPKPGGAVKPRSFSTLGS